MSRMRGGGPPPSERRFAFVTSLLQPGDILFCRNPLSRDGRAIEIATDGDFSHATICVAPPLFLEANDPGVGLFHLDRFCVSDRRNVRIMRLRSGLVPDAAAIGAKAAAEAMKYQALPYELLGAMLSIVPGAPRQPGGLFCSQLAALAYEKAWRRLTPKTRPPHKTTPADLGKSRFLQDVTDQLLVEIHLEPDSRFELLDAEHTETSGQAFSRALRAAGEIAADFIEGQKLPRPIGYMEVQKAYGLGRGESWASQLDEVFAAALMRLATPILEAARPVDEATLAENYIRLPPRIAGYDEPSVVLAFNKCRLEYDSTLRRLQESETFVAGAEIAANDGRPSATIRVWIEHERIQNEVAAKKLEWCRHEMDLLIARGRELGLYG